MKRYLFLVLNAVAGAIMISAVNFALQSPKAKDQKVIADCWAESKGVHLTPTQQQTVIGACQMLEKVYQLNDSPQPGRKDV